MGACTYGAVPDPSKPASVYVSVADFERWLGPTIYGKLAPWVWEQGTHGYEVAALAALNPDTPGPITDLEITIASSNPISAMLFASRLAEFGKYMAFAENCLCMSAPTGQCPMTGGVMTFSTTFTSDGFQDFDIPVGAKAIRFQRYETSSANFGAFPQWQIAHYHSGSWHIVYSHFANGGPLLWEPDDYVLPHTSLAGEKWEAYISSGVTGRAFHANMQAEACTDVPGPVGNPVAAPAPLVPTSPTYPTYGTCATIADVCTKLDQVLAMGAATKRDVDIIQRQSVPFAYIPGASHAVTGHGQFDVADLLGLAVTFTAIPARLPVEVGTPDTIWQLGRITLGTADGWQRNITLTHSPALVVPVSGFVTKVGYTLPLGVAATIQELRAEY